jgi:hypothetical protein
MQVYAIRKRGGQWAVCSEENVQLKFETYDEAVEVARAAAEVLASRRDRIAGAMQGVQPATVEAR